LKAITDETVVAKRVGTDEYYHKGCAPEGATDVKASDEPEVYDPELDHRACIQCGRWLLTGVHRTYYLNYCERKVREIETHTDY
jgi:hypothetical protein